MDAGDDRSRGLGLFGPHGGVERAVQRSVRVSDFAVCQQDRKCSINTYLTKISVEKKKIVSVCLPWT